MASGLGLDVGSTTSIAVSTAAGDHPRTYVSPTALRLEPGREPALTAATEGGGVLTGFTGRVGDPVGLVTDDGRTYTGDELYATTLACLAHLANTDGDDAAVVVTHPTGWPPYTVDRLRNAAARHGLTDVTFVPEAIAAVAWLQRSPDAIDGDGVVLVYDLGGSALDVAVVSTGDESRIVGRGARSEDISGTHFDHVVLAHVLESVDADGLDPFDPATVDALAALRVECARAKEVLSSDTETVVAVRLPGIESDVRLVRSEVEELFRDSIDGSMDVVDEALRSAGVDASDITRVLLTGGGAAIPLVTETVSSAMRVPLTTSDDPASTAAVGAALLASEVAATSAELDRVGAASALAVIDDTAPAELPARSAVSMSKAGVSTTGLPTRTATSHAKKTGGKRVALIAGTAVAIALLAAGGLSVGTGLIGGGDSPADGGAATTSAVVDGAAVEESTAGGAGTTGAPAAGAASTTGAAAPGTTGANGAPAAGSTDAGAGQSAAGGNAATQAPAGTQAPAAQVPAVQVPSAPTFQAPAVQAPSVPPYTAPSLPSNPLPGVVGGVTDGLGNTLNGVGTGAGNAVGGVVGGLTNPIFGN